jgi:hypothetical protein
MSNIIELSAIRLAREKFAIALAGAVHETFFAGFDEPLRPQFGLEALAEELLGLTNDDIEKIYRQATARVVAHQNGLTIVPPGFANRVDVKALHREAVDWARALLEQTERNYGVRLLGRGAHD